jgi:hypothetical protein
MEVADRHQFTQYELREINHCRVYLQVITVSDIIDASGMRILPTAIKGIRDAQHPSSLHWPEWHRPTSWTAWSRLLQLISTSGCLPQELGSWIAPSHQQWQWFHDTSQDVVYHMQSSDQWVRYTRAHVTKVTRRSRTLYSTPTSCSAPTPLQLLFPTTEVVQPNQSIRSFPSSSPMTTKVPTTLHTLWNPAQVPPELLDTPSFNQRLIGLTPLLPLNVPKLLVLLSRIQSF